jgi:dehydrogenase/reductase SDR family protein 9
MKVMVLTIIMMMAMIASVSSLLMTRKIPISMSLQDLKPAQSVVLITGCDTGFGLLATSQLSKAGYKVIAACLTTEGCATIDEISGAVSVLCDVTKESDIRNLALTAETMLAGDDQLRLWAVINNAGIAPLGYVDWMAMESVRRVMEVNYFGLVSVTKVCFKSFFTLPCLFRYLGL